MLQCDFSIQHHTTAWPVYSQILLQSWKSRGHKRGEIWKEEEMKEGIFNSLPKQSFHLTCTKRIKRFKMTKRYDVFLQTWLQRLRQRWEKSIRNPLKKKSIRFHEGYVQDYGLSSFIGFFEMYIASVEKINGEFSKKKKMMAWCCCPRLVQYKLYF